MGSVSKYITGKNRDEAGQRLLALSHLSMGIVNRYPHRIQQFTQYQHETAMNTAQVLREQEAQRQAAKKANRQKNRAMIGSVAGAALGGVTGGGSFAAMSAGAKVGGSIAGGDVGGVAGGLGSFASTQAQLGQRGGGDLGYMPTDDELSLGGYGY